jgi:adenosylcobinamide-GDP ribazoletransferase
VITALAFLTRLPVGRSRSFGAKEVARSERWFPLVGCLLGGIYAAALWLCARVFPASICAILVVGVDAWLTGAMHFDGIADSADGFGGGRTREDVLRIMRDHAIGSYGAVALLLVIALKIAAIASLVGCPTAWAAILLAPVLGRWAAVLLSAARPYARPPEHDGPYSVGSPTRFVGRTEIAIATVTALAIAAPLGIGHSGPACAAVLALVVIWGAYCQKRIGGITGDTVGAAIEIAECAVLLIYAAGH